MSTPITLNTYRVTWVTGADRATVHAHKVNAANWEISPSAGFAYFRDADNAVVFTISTSFLISVELVTEKD